MTKYTSITQSRRVGFAVAARNIKLFFPGIGASENFKNLPPPFLKPRSTHSRQQSSNTTRGPVPLNDRMMYESLILKNFRIYGTSAAIACVHVQNQESAWGIIGPMDQGILYEHRERVWGDHSNLTHILVAVSKMKKDQTSHPPSRQQDEERLDLSSKIPSAGRRKTRPLIPHPVSRMKKDQTFHPLSTSQRTRLFSDETQLESWPLLCRSLENQTFLG